MRTPRMPLILFVLSALVLTLEVLETKIFAYSLENSLIFLVIGTVLLGFGAGGSALALRKALGDPRRLVRRNLLATAVLLVVAHAWFAQFSDRLDFRVDLWTLSILVLLAAPYFSAGMVVSAILADPNGSVHARYGLNLLGSAVGCVTVFLVLGPISGPRLLVSCALAVALLAVPVAGRKLRLSALILAIGVPLWSFADAVLPYRIQKAETAGQLALIERTAAEVVAEHDRVQRLDVVERFDRWDPTARVQVHALDVQTTDANISKSLDGLPSMWFTQDSSYGSPLIGRGPSPDGVRGVFERTCYGAGYFRGRRRQDVLVIGLGGAPDVQTALYHDAASVTGVDINRTAVEMVRGPMREFLGDPYGDPRVDVHIRDGRSFVRASERRWDLIQLSGVDTKSVLASGTLALNESYLYTREAFDEYLAHLEPDGLLCIVYAGGVFRDRLAVTAIGALERRGAERPAEHLMIVDQSAIFCLLVKREAFTADEVVAMEEWLERADAGDGALDEQTGVVVWVYELLNPGLSLNRVPRAVYLPGRPTAEPVMRAAVAGELERYVAEHPANIAPAPDRRPFFFNTIRTRDVLAHPPEHFARAFRLLGIMAGLAFALILGPLLVLGRRGFAVWRNLPFAVYFAALGAGYVMAMSGLIQRYVLFLGHQSYAFAVVIGGLLVAAGLGSFLAGRYERSPARVMTVSVVAICAMLALIQLVFEPLLSATAGLSQPVRIALGLALIAPLGVPLGMLFPTGLALVRRNSPLFVPWAFGVNGVFSVIGTSIVLPGAVLFGFPTMAAAAGAVYLLALAVGVPLARRA